jgi:hypothetical protein
MDRSRSKQLEQSQDYVELQYPSMGRMEVVALVCYVSIEQISPFFCGLQSLEWQLTEEGRTTTGEEDD